MVFGHHHRTARRARIDAQQLERFDESQPTLLGRLRQLSGGQQLRFLKTLSASDHWKLTDELLAENELVWRECQKSKAKNEKLIEEIRIQEVAKTQLQHALYNMSCEIAIEAGSKSMGRPSRDSVRRPQRALREVQSMNLSSKRGAWKAYNEQGQAICDDRDSSLFDLDLAPHNY